MTRRLLALILAGAGLALGAPAAAARDDWQLWLEQKWHVKLSPAVALVGKTEERYRRDMSDFYSQLAAVGVAWQAAPWLTITPGYHYQWTQATPDDKNENRLYLEATPRWSWRPLTVEDRQRIEFRHISGVDDWRYRHRPKLSVTVGRGWATVKPYVADEVFYGARAGEWVRNRFLAGLAKPITRAVSADVYYVLQSDRSGRDWDEFHVLGVSVSAKF